MIDDKFSKFPFHVHIVIFFQMSNIIENKDPKKKVDDLLKVFLSRPQGQRRRGRPKSRWQDGVEASAIKAGDNGQAGEGARSRAGQDRKAVVAPVSKIISW